MINSAPHTEGQCRCGKVEFFVKSTPLMTTACHCTGCQHMTSSAFSLSALYKEENFKITTGDVTIGGLHGKTRHYFCPHCMSWIFTHLEGIDGLVNVRATLLENAHDFRPFVETYTSEKLPWVTTPAQHSFEKFPELVDFSKLLSEYRNA